MGASDNRPEPGRDIPYVLAACTAVSVLSTDVITPSIPDLPQALDTTVVAAQLTVSVNLAAYALAQLVHGPLADAIGRRRLLLVAFACFVVFSAACALAPTIDLLLYGRFLQGTASSVPSVVIVLLIRELYGPQKALQVMALYGAALGLAPALGPLIGGYLHVWFGWRAGFWFVAAIALAVLYLCWRRVPETLTEPAPLNFIGALRTYRALCRTSAFIRPALGVSMLFGAFYAYVTTAPVVMIDLLGMATNRFGLTSLAIVLAFVLGNLVASHLSTRLSSEQVLRRAASLTVVAMILLVAPIAFGITQVHTIVLAMLLYGGCLALVLAAGPLVVLSAATKVPSGPASALLGALQLAASALAGFFSAVLYNDTALPMVLVMLAFVAVGTALILSGVSGGARAADRAG